jgi:copper chaperone CopZ
MADMLVKVLQADGVRISGVETRSIVVAGMSCDHCANAIRAEIGRLPGVAGVDVDVAAGKVRITGEPLPGDMALREAVEEAGYEFAG